MKNLSTGKAAATRGPAEHSVRDQIVKAARECFAHYGYDKTTVSDLAREIGFSKAYIYRFFESKQAIGEAICDECVTGLFDQVREAVDQGEDATDKLRRFAKTVTTATVELLFTDRKLYEIAAHASSENWEVVRAYTERLQGLLEEILKEGRENGEFERKTPLDETRRSIFYTFRPFIDPVFLEHGLDLLPDAQTEVTGLVLRSLAP
ncbi:TetR/AcrR family transcriptional regulator [Sphingomonas sp. G-3-2-10]|uniref:TetR/AcrR family transcriptional regulator n=1 Tax=Sphingomonas sp. G-3-2-10 TaxID=2728838 RepID=UPI00146EBA42|nr:TetR/AcrR family transcriptional regulator [Sphingomonas sp. G-3-2-10]NML08043.1 TetR/AcrR family transcriptional regulator [Sphingomonas sp. G-3-2-10]